MPAVNKSSKIALSGICGSLSIVIMMISSAIPIASLALPAIAGCVLIPVIAFAGEKYAYMVYAVVSVLSFLLVADREAMLIYILFFGYYPVLYSSLCKIKNKVISLLTKLVIFNFSAVCDYLIVTFIFGIPTETIEILGEFTLIVMLIIANIAFLLYDNALIGLGIIYDRKLHPLLKKHLLRK